MLVAAVIAMPSDDPTLPGRPSRIVPAPVSVQVDAALVVARKLDTILEASRAWGDDLRTWVEDVRALVDVVLPHGHLRAALRRARSLSVTSSERMTDLYRRAASDLGVLPSDGPRMSALRLALGQAYDAGVDSADAALVRLRAELAVAEAELHSVRRECEVLHRAMDRLGEATDGVE